MVAIIARIAKSARNFKHTTLKPTAESQQPIPLICRPALQLSCHWLDFRLRTQGYLNGIGNDGICPFGLISCQLNFPVKALWSIRALRLTSALGQILGALLITLLAIRH